MPSTTDCHNRADFYRILEIFAVPSYDTVNLKIYLGFHIEMIRTVRLINVFLDKKNVKDLIRAQSWLETRLRQCNDLYLFTYGAQDRQNRVLGQIYCGCSKYSINDEMIKEGLALKRY